MWIFECEYVKTQMKRKANMQRMEISEQGPVHSLELMLLREKWSIE